MYGDALVKINNNSIERRCSCNSKRHKRCSCDLEQDQSHQDSVKYF